MKHQVIVGNIGMIYNGVSEIEARNCFVYYQDTSMCNLGRAAGESVTWYVDGEVFKEHIGQIDKKVEYEN